MKSDIDIVYRYAINISYGDIRSQFEEAFDHTAVRKYMEPDARTQVMFPAGAPDIGKAGPALGTWHLVIGTIDY